MRHRIGLGVVLLLLARGEGLATGNQPPPCRPGSWVGTGAMKTARILHAATLLPSGKVLVTGGVDFVGTAVATAELYDPATGNWSPTGSMSIPRYWHTMTLLPTGKVLAAGGFSQAPDLGEGPDTRPAELYDPDTGQWTTTGAMLDRRGTHTATLLPTGKVLVTGGSGSAGVVPGLASAELYDSTTGEWHATGALSVARVVHTATLLASGQVLVLGGILGPQSSAELYDPAAGTWTAAAPMLAARFLHTATLLPAGTVLVAGGASDAREAELYDPAAGTWRRTDSLLAPHAGHTATRLPSGRVLVVDGLLPGVDFGRVRNTELFDPESETWSDAGCTVEARLFHTATLLLSGAVLVAGGEDSSGQSRSSAELYGIVASPAQVSLATGASQTFTATGGAGVGYAWSFRQNESGGTLTASGDYQAGQVGGVTDVLQVVDSYANSATVTVNVVRQATAVSTAGPQSRTIGCDTGGGAAVPSLAGAVLVLLGWSWLRVRHPCRTRGSGTSTKCSATSTLRSHAP